jgi:hypothetical protein
MSHAVVTGHGSQEASLGSLVYLHPQRPLRLAFTPTLRQLTSLLYLAL